MRTSKTLLALGSRIRRQRIKQKLTQERLAMSAAINAGLLSAIERGEEDVPLECLLRIAKALRTSAADLCEDIDD